MDCPMRLKRYARLVVTGGLLSWVASQGVVPVSSWGLDRLPAVGGESVKPIRLAQLPGSDSILVRPAPTTEPSATAPPLASPNSPALAITPDAPATTRLPATGRADDTVGPVMEYVPGATAVMSAAELQGLNPWSAAAPAPFAPWLQWAPPANAGGDAQEWLAPYAELVAGAAMRSTVASPAAQSEFASPLPADFVAWWDELVKQRQAVASGPRPVGLDQLIEAALRHSSFVSIVAVEPEIRRSNIVVEQAEFDWRTYLESSFTKTNDPVGNTLTTGNSDTRFHDNTWSMDGGVRRRTAAGGQLDFAQRFGTQTNNSRFLLPNPQGTSRLELQYTQPLLNGSGRCVNESRIVLAQLETDIAGDDAVQELQNHLVKVTEGYWELYRARAEFFQRSKLLAAAQGTLEVLQGREAVDTVGRQILRAKAAVTSRQSEIVRARTAIRNAESQLRLLVNSPELVNLGPFELTPRESPLSQPLPVSMQDSLQTALLNRPDISRAIREVRGATVRTGVAANQVLPKLDLVASTYVAGLAGHHDFTSAFGKQWSDGGPSFTAGFLFEIPWGNRAALAKMQQRELEMNRALSKFRLTVEQSLTTLEIAVREAETSYREMVSRHQAMTAAETEVNYLSSRWREIPGVDDSAAFLLENLLDAQARLADEEAAMVRAQVGYEMSIVRLKQEMGTLLKAVPLEGSVAAPPVTIIPNTPAAAVPSGNAAISRLPASPRIGRLPATTE